VEENCLGLRQGGIVAIQMSPSRLNHPYTGIEQMRHHPQQRVARRNEIGVKHCEQLGARQRESVSERAGFESQTRAAANLLDSDSALPQFSDLHRDDRFRPVRRVVENLDVELAWIAETAHA